MCGTSVIENKKQLMTITVLLSIFFTLISAPWDWGLTFWGDSIPAWVIYYAVGIALTIYSTWAFVRAIKILSTHERSCIKGCSGE